MPIMIVEQIIDCIARYVETSILSEYLELLNRPPHLLMTMKDYPVAEAAGVRASGSPYPALAK